jgi:menaquinone-dependent protoporphyrinogen oxidase
MKVLVAFGTTEGQTRQIARRICSTVEDLGHSCNLYDCGGDGAAPAISDFDAVIVAASVHQRQHQKTVADFVRNRVAELQAIPNAFVSVSLSITVDEGREEAESYITGFAEDTGWTPAHVHMAAGAIRYLEYDFLKEFTIRHIVYKGKTPMPPKGSNPEFTDWDALDSFVRSSLA